jgi:hypothetical protein
MPSGGYPCAPRAACRAKAQLQAGGGAVRPLHADEICESGELKGDRPPPEPTDAAFGKTRTRRSAERREHGSGSRQTAGERAGGGGEQGPARQCARAHQCAEHHVRAALAPVGGENPLSRIEQIGTLALARAPEYALPVADVVSREGILLAAREVVVLFAVLVFLAWVGYRLMREGHR